MKFKFSLIAACAALLHSVPAHAAITINYDNITGDYEIFGGDSGTGATGGNTDYLWQFTNSAFTIDANIISDAIRIDGLTGQLNGTPASLASNTTLSSILVWSFTPNTGGPLALNSKNSTVTAGLWSYGDGTFTANAAHPNTDESFTLNVGSIPEASTFALLAGLSGLASVALRRRA